jgi:hypothetical protein
VLTAIDLHDKTLLEADKIENVILERHLTTKFERSDREEAATSPPLRR